MAGNFNRSIAANKYGRNNFGEQRNNFGEQAERQSQVFILWRESIIRGSNHLICYTKIKYGETVYKIQFPVFYHANQEGVYAKSFVVKGFGCFLT